MITMFHKLNTAFDRFLFSSCDPVMCSVLRIAVGLLACIYALGWLPDGVLWFSNEGVLQARTSEILHNGQYKSLYHLMPQDPIYAQAGMLLLLTQSVLLLFGVAGRFQAACIFFLLTSFQHRNVLIVDGQDTVMRWLIFFLVFMPVDHKWSLWRAIRRGPPSNATIANAWGVRMVQMQLTVIYFSTAVIKLYGTTWRDGSALYYVARMDDVFGRFWLPDYLFESDWTLRPITWIVLAVEVALPFALWVPRLRLAAVASGFLLHLSIEYAMNIFLFEWLMMAGLLSFLRPSDFVRLPQQPSSSRTEDTEALRQLATHRTPEEIAIRTSR